MKAVCLLTFVICVEGVEIATHHRTAVAEESSHESGELSTFANNDWLSNLFGAGRRGDRLSTFMSTRVTPWYKGPNVCKREADVAPTKSPESQPDVSEFVSLFSSISSSCADGENVYKCTITTVQDGIRKEHVVIYECCHGFTRDPSEHGCPTEVHLLGTAASLEGQNASRFVRMIEKAGLGARLREENITVFGVSDAALEAIQQSEEGVVEIVPLESSNEDKMALLLGGHMMNGIHMTYDLADEQRITGPSGNVWTINHFRHPNRFTTVNCAPIVAANVATSNGVLHMVDRLVIGARQTAWDTLSYDTAYSSFVDLIPSSLAAQLQDGDWVGTVIAFDNDAYDRLPSGLRDRLEDKDDCVKDFIASHILPHTICSMALQGRANVLNINGDLLNATRDEQSNELFINGVSVRLVDTITTNAVIHTIDEPLVMDRYLTAFEYLAKHNPEMEAAMDNELTSALAAEEVTLLLPPFNSSSPQHRGILANHIIPSTFYFNESLKEITTMADVSYDVDVTCDRCHLTPIFLHRPPSATIGCARILHSNIRVCNGVVHQLDRMLPIPHTNVMASMRDKPQLTAFVRMIEMAGMEGEMEQGEFDGTVLAVSNEAMEKLLANETIAKQFEEEETARRFVHTHIIPDILCCHSIGHGTRHASRTRDNFLFGNPWRRRGIRYRTLLDGRTVTVNGDETNGITVDGANITSCDNVAENGLVHVIDKALPVVKNRSRWERPQSRMVNQLMQQFNRLLDN